MKFIIFIADTIRHGNFPRVDQFEYSPEYGMYLYLGRELTSTEFNEACKRVFDPDFRNQGFTFRPQAVGPEVDAEIAAAEEAAEAQRIANEAESQKIAEAIAKAEAQRLADEAKAAAEAMKDEEPPVESDESSSPSEADTPPETESEPVKFRLDGKGIFVGEERVAGLFGESKQLRVLSEHDSLRPEIEAWLQTLTSTEQ